MGPGQICDFRSSSRLCVKVGVGGCLGGGGEAGSCFPFILEGRGSPPCPSPTCLELQSPPLQCWWTGNRRWWEVGIEGDPQKTFWLVLGRSGRPQNLCPRKHIFTQVYLRFCREAGEDLKDPWQDVVPEHSCPHQLPVWGFPGLHLGAEPLIV